MSDKIPYFMGYQQIMSDKMSDKKPILRAFR